MLEAKAIDRIVEFDIHSEIVGVQLQFVSLAERFVLLDIQANSRDRAVYQQNDVVVTVRMSLETSIRR